MTLSDIDLLTASVEQIEAAAKADAEAGKSFWIRSDHSGQWVRERTWRGFVAVLWFRLDAGLPIRIAVVDPVGSGGAA